MEIDLSEARPGLALLFLAAVIALAALGRMYTPADGRMLTWQEWQIQKAERQYRRELGELQQTLDQLAAFYNQGQRDPVRGQYLADRAVERIQAQESPALAQQRQAVLEAVEAVRRWSLGVARDEDVHVALERALEIVSER